MKKLFGLVHDLWHAGGTGGLNWHVHACVARHRWKGTISEIDRFLQQVQPNAKDLVLIGASAGWMMPPSWLVRFDRIDAYDIDPLAAHLFNRRHGQTLRAQGTELFMHRQDALASLPDLLIRHPHACLWFDNLLGQHRYRVRDEVLAEQQLTALKHQLHGRSWGSVHDLYSGPTHHMAWVDRIESLTRYEVEASQLDSQQAQALLHEVSAKDVWSDHLTTQVFAPGTPTTLIPWPFKDHHCHWLQAGWVQGFKL
jgi:hypothetical protein